jgi:hypothetical protein
MQIGQNYVCFLTVQSLNIITHHSELIDLFSSAKIY